jgi:hypothetical protein
LFLDGLVVCSFIGFPFAQIFEASLRSWGGQAAHCLAFVRLLHTALNNVHRMCPDELRAIGTKAIKMGHAYLGAIMQVLDENIRVVVMQKFGQLAQQVLNSKRRAQALRALRALRALNQSQCKRLLFIRGLCSQVNLHYSCFFPFDLSTSTPPLWSATTWSCASSKQRLASHRPSCERRVSSQRMPTARPSPSTHESIHSPLPSARSTKYEVRMP